MSGELDFEELDAAVNEFIQQEKTSEKIKENAAQLSNQSQKPPKKSPRPVKKSTKKTTKISQSQPIQTKNPAKPPIKSARIMDFAPQVNQDSTPQKAWRNSPRRGRSIDMVLPTKNHKPSIRANFSQQHYVQNSPSKKILSDIQPRKINASNSANEDDFAREIARAFEIHEEKFIAPQLDSINDSQKTDNSKNQEIPQQKKSKPTKAKNQSAQKSDDDAAISPFLENIAIKKTPLGNMPPTALSADNGGRGELAAQIEAKKAEDNIDVNVKITTLEENTIEKEPKKMTETEFIDEFLANIKQKTEEINAVAEEILHEAKTENIQEDSAENNFNFSKNSAKQNSEVAPKNSVNQNQKNSAQDLKKKSPTSPHLPRKKHAHQWPKEKNFTAVAGVAKSENFHKKAPIAASTNFAQQAKKKSEKLHNGWRIIGWIVAYLILIGAGGALGILIYLNGWI